MPDDLLAFIVFALAWTGGAGLLVGVVHPVAIFIVWLVGFVWGAGYIAAGPSDADLLLRRWLQMMTGVAALALVGALLIS